MHQEAEGTKTDEAKHLPTEHPVQETRKKLETKRRWSKAGTEFCRRHHGHTQVHGRDLLCDLGENPLTSLNLCSSCITWE